MVAWILCSLLKNKKVVTIMLWNVTTVLVYSSVFLVSDTYVLDDWYRVILFLSIIILYFVLGLFADAFIGRYRLIQFSLWVQWATVIMSTFISAMLEYYDIAQWIQSLLFLALLILIFICWDYHHFKMYPYSLAPTNFKVLQVITSVHSYSGMSHDRASFGCTDSVDILFAFPF